LILHHANSFSML